MTRTRKRKSENKQPSMGVIREQALVSAFTMEQAVFQRIVAPEFTANDIVDYLWPTEEVEVLRRAFPIARPYYTALHYEIAIPVKAFFVVDCAKVGLAPRKDDTGIITPQNVPAAPAIEQMLREVSDVAQHWATVGHLIRTLTQNRHATIGRIKHFMPTFGALLPAESVFHTTNPVNSNVFSDINPDDVRAAVNAITEGIFGRPLYHAMEASIVGVQIKFPNGALSPIYHLF